MSYWKATVARGSFIINLYQTVIKHFHNFTGFLYSIGSTLPAGDRPGFSYRRESCLGKLTQCGW